MPKIVDHDVRRDELGESVLRVLTREGANSVTLRAVAQEAGWSVGVVQHYFTTKDEMVQFAMELAFERAEKRITEIVDSDLDPMAKLQRVLEQGLPLDEVRLEEWAAWIAFWSEAATDARLAREQENRYASWRRLIKQLLRDARGSGLMSAELDPGFEAEALVAYIDGIGLQAVFAPQRLSRRKLINALERYLKRLNEGRLARTDV